MPDIQFRDLTKTYGAVTAFDGITAHVTAGRVTAFLGANGSGKTTTMRILLGLSEPDAGSATLGGMRYRDLTHPLRVVGAVLDQGFHPNRSARNHLRIIAAQAGVARTRVEEVLNEVGLLEAGGRRVGGFSLGMRQRLSLAAAMIGRPETLSWTSRSTAWTLTGIQSMRAFLRRFADRGGTVLLSSHLLSEIAHSADDAIIIDHGRLLRSGPVTTLAAVRQGIIVTTPDVGSAQRRLPPSRRPRAARWRRLPHCHGPITRDDRPGRARCPGARHPDPHPGRRSRGRFHRTHRQARRSGHDHAHAHRAAQTTHHARGLGRPCADRILDRRLGVLEHPLGWTPGRSGRRHGRQPQQVFATGVVSSNVMLVLGIMIAAGEDRHRTCWRRSWPSRDANGSCWPSSARRPAGPGVRGTHVRLHLAVAVPLYATRGVHHLPVSIAALWLGTTLLTACFGLLGVALGALTRNTVAPSSARSAGSSSWNSPFCSH